MSFENVFELLPKELHEIIQSFLSLWDCVAMSKISQSLNQIWKKFIEYTPERRLKILYHVVRPSIILEQCPMIIKRIMSSEILSDLSFPNVVLDQKKNLTYDFLYGLLKSVLFAMKSIVHFKRIFAILDELVLPKIFATKCYSIVYEHTREHGFGCWDGETLVKVINWLMLRPEEWSNYKCTLTKYRQMEWSSLIDFDQIVKDEKRIEKIHKIGSSVNGGYPFFCLSGLSFYREVIKERGRYFSTMELINLIHLINVEELLVNGDIIIHIFDSIFHTCHGPSYEIGIQTEKAIEVWKGVKREVKLVIFDHVLHYAIMNRIPLADFLWNDRLSVRSKFEPLTTDQIYKMMVIENCLQPTLKQRLDWIHIRLGPVFTPAFLALIMDYNNYDLMSILFKNDEIDVNECYMGKTPLQRLIKPQKKIYAFHREVCAILSNCPDLDWTSDKQGMLDFLNNLAINNYHLIEDLRRYENFKNAFELMCHPERRHYIVTLLNPSKKQKVLI